MGLSSETTVYVVDDDESVRKGLSILIRSIGQKVEAYASAEDFLRQVNLSHPCCVILDVHMPGIDGPRLQKILKENNVEIPIIFLTADGTVPTVVDAMRLGAVDFLTKPLAEEDLFSAIERAITLDDEQVRLDRERAVIQSRVDTLTDREREVLTYVIVGLPNKVIGDRLGAAEKTIKVHRGRMTKKMEADSVADLIRMADKVGINPAE